MGKIKKDQLSCPLQEPWQRIEFITFISDTTVQSSHYKLDWENLLCQCVFCYGSTDAAVIVKECVYFVNTDGNTDAAAIEK